MTAIDWLKAMESTDGCEADLFEFCDWLEEEGYQREAEAARGLPGWLTLTGIRDLQGSPGNSLVLEVSAERGGRFLVFQEENGAGLNWNHRGDAAAALLADSCSGGFPDAAPLRHWLKAAIGCRLLSWRQQPRQVRFRLRQGY